MGVVYLFYFLTATFTDPLEALLWMATTWTEPPSLSVHWQIRVVLQTYGKSGNV
jgi:hypothetical protein